MLRPGDAAPMFTLQPVMGLPVKLEGHVTVVCFLRPLEGSVSRTAIATLQEAWSRFDAEGIQLVGITRTDLTFGRDFVPRYHVLFPIVIDETGEYSQAYDIPCDKGFMGTLKGLRPEAVRTFVGSLEHGRGAPRLPSTILPAEFVIGRDGAVRYAHYATSVLDQPDIEALWNAAREG